MTPKKPVRILKLVNTSIRDDPRVINEGKSLIKLGYFITTIGVARDANAGIHVRDNIENMQTILVPMVTTSSLPRLLKELWRLLRGNLGTKTEPPTSRMSNFISFVFFNLWLLRAAIYLPVDVVHCHDILPLPAAWILARWHRAKFVYDARESVPGLYVGLKGRAMTTIEQFLLVKADAVITVGDRLAESLRKRGAKNVIVIGNWKRLEEYTISADQLVLERKRLGLDQAACIISYLGALDPTREIMPLIEAIANSPSTILLIGGRGMIKEDVRIAAEKLPNIRWLDWVPLADVALYTHLSTAVYYCLNFDQNAQTSLSIDNNFYSTPNKLFDAFAAGKAIIARKGIGEIGEILERIPAGILLDEVTPQSLQAAFEELRDPQRLQSLQLGALQGRQLYNWQVAEERLQKLYADLTQA